MKIQQNISLSNFCTFRTGGCAKYFVVVSGVEGLKQAIDFSQKNQLPVFVLGGGSNLLISDEGVDGLVIKMEIKGIEFESSLRGAKRRSNPELSICGKIMDGGLSSCSEAEGGATSGSNFGEKIQNIQTISSAGENWDDFVALCVEKGLCGIENLSYIPGTVGASAVQNIGAYGVEVKDIIDWVEVFDIGTREIKKITGKACDFGYRDSIFKKPEGKNFIVIRVAYNLQKFEKRTIKLKTDYKDIQEYFSCEKDGDRLRLSPSRQQLRQAIIKIRQNKLPDWKKIGTAG